MEQALLDSGAPVAVLRPGAIHGILARHPREWVFVKRVLDGRQAVPVVHAQGRFGTTAAAAVGSLTQAVLQAGAGGVFNVADADAPPVSAIAQAIAGLMGRPLQVVPIPPQEGAEDHVGHTPWSVPGPMVLDCARAAALGWTAPPYAQSVAPLVDWLAGHAGADWRAAFPGFGHYGFDPFDYATEDRVLARLG
jgi:nucleoside-diphosphate-sugar epimerase